MCRLYHTARNGIAAVVQNMLEMHVVLMTCVPAEQKVGLLLISCCFRHADRQIADFCAVSVVGTRSGCT